MHAKGLAGFALLWQARGKAEVMWNQAAPQYEKLRAQVQQEIARLRVMFEQVRPLQARANRQAGRPSVSTHSTNCEYSQYQP